MKTQIGLVITGSTNEGGGDFNCLKNSYLPVKILKLHQIVTNVNTNTLNFYTL